MTVQGNTFRGPLQFHCGLRSVTWCELNSGAILGPFNPVYGAHQHQQKINRQLCSNLFRANYCPRDCPAKGSYYNPNRIQGGLRGVLQQALLVPNVFKYKVLRSEQYLELVSMQRKARGVVSGVLVSPRQGAIREPGVEPPWSPGPAKFKSADTTRPIEVLGEVGMMVLVTGWVLLTRTSVTSKS